MSNVVPLFKVPEPTYLFLDLETGGLRFQDAPWEIAFKRVTPENPAGTLHVWHLADFQPGEADPAALAMGGFYDRHPMFAPDPDVAVMNIAGPNLDTPVDHQMLPAQQIARMFERHSRGAILVCCNPTYDAPKMAHLMFSYGLASTWHYRPVCATTLAAGAINAYLSSVMHPPLPLPWNNKEIGAWMGVDRNGFGTAHTGLADCLYAEALFKAVQEGVVPKDPAG